MTINSDDEAIEWLTELLSFKTISNSAANDDSYNLCAQYLCKICTTIGLETQILPESKQNKPIVLALWHGKQRDLPAIILNSHYDVVPVIEEFWEVPAFEKCIKDGKIYGRGAQDMKSVCIQYLVAIQRLKSQGYQPLRTVILSYVPDEEIGGYDGMNILLGSSFFVHLQNNNGIAVALDEGLANEGDNYTIFYGERLPWWIEVTAVGNTGHGSRFIEGTAIEQILQVTQKALLFRQDQKKILHGNTEYDVPPSTESEPSSSSATNAMTTGCKRSRSTPQEHLHTNCSHSVAFKKRKTLGDVTTLNITQLHAGISSGGVDVINLVPSIATAKFDIRIAPHQDPEEILNELDTWCQEASASGLPLGGGVQWKFIGSPLKKHSITQIEVDRVIAQNEVNVASLQVTGTNEISKDKSNPDLTLSTSTSGKHDSRTEMVSENEKWLELIQSTLFSNFQISIEPEIFPAATDSRFLRALAGVRAFGFSPIRKNPILLHEHNEYIKTETFLEGCQVYTKLIEALSSHP